MAKKKGFFGAVGRFLGSIPVVGKAKKAGKAVKKKVKTVKKKAKKTVKKVKKKLKKKVGKVFTKARKLKNNLSKSKLVKKVKRTVKKVVVKTKKVVKKAKAVVKSAKKQTKKVVQQVKQTAKKTVQQTKQQLKTVVKETKKAATKVGGKVAIAYTSFKAGGYKETLSVVADCIPIVGNAKAAYEAISGKDPFTGRKLKEWERTFAAAAVLGGPAVKVVKHGGKLVGGIVKHTSPAIAKNVEKLTNALEQIQLGVAFPRPTVQLASVSGVRQVLSQNSLRETIANNGLVKSQSFSLDKQVKKTDVTGDKSDQKEKSDYDKLKERLNQRYKDFVDKKKQNVPQTSDDFLPNELDHDKFKDVVKTPGDNITGHHMPSNKYMNDKFGINTRESYAINLEHIHPGSGGRHRRTFTYGLSSTVRPEDFKLYMSLNPRDALAFDINDLRRILKEDDLYNKDSRKKIKEYIAYYKNYRKDDLENGLKIFDKP